MSMLTVDKTAVEAKTRVMDAVAEAKQAISQGKHQLEDLHDTVTYRGGGGIKYPLAMRSTGRIKGAGIRLDAALIVTTGGVAKGSGAARQVAATSSLYLIF